MLKHRSGRNSILEYLSGLLSFDYLFMFRDDDLTDEKMTLIHYNVRVMSTFKIFR